jgi:DNA-binding LacI/PurR family transcriptional regulator
MEMDGHMAHSKRPSQIQRRGHGPMYEQICEILRRRIREGEVKPGDLLPSIKELCSEFDVSTITVRQALDVLEDEGLIDKRPGWGNSVRDTLHSRAELRTPPILLLDHRGVPLWDAYTSEIKASIERAIRQAGFAFQYGPTDPQWLGDFLTHHAGESRGVILLSGSYRSIQPYIGEFDLPVVAFSREDQTSDDNHIRDIVNIADRAGIADVVDHLIGLGHRRIAYAGLMAESYAGARRREAFLQTLQAHGIAPENDLVVEAGFSMEEGRQAGARVLAARETPTALVCANDYLALGAVSEFHSRGLKIPADISVTGFDNLDMAAHAFPALTTVSIDRGRLGDALARLMIERLANPLKPYTVLEYDVALVVRETSAPPK